MHAAMLDVLGAREGGLDPGWPPVLVVLVVGVIGAGVFAVVMMLRALRDEARPGRSRRARGRGGSTRGRGARR